MLEPTNNMSVNIASLGLSPDLEFTLSEIAAKDGDADALDTPMEFLEAHLHLKSIDSGKKLFMPKADVNEVVVWEEENGFVQYSLEGDTLVRRENEITSKKAETKWEGLVNPKLATDGESAFVIVDRPKGGSQLINFSCREKCGDIDFCRWSLWKDGWSRIDYSDFTIKDSELYVSFKNGDIHSVPDDIWSYCYYSLANTINSRECAPQATQNADGSVTFGNCLEEN